MKKKHTKKMWKYYCDFAKIFKVTLLILLLLLAVAQLNVDRYLLDRSNSQSTRTQDLIIEAVRGQRKEAVVDGPTGKVYLPDVHLVLPAYPEDIRGVLYSYDHSGEAISDDEVLITSTTALGYGISRVNVAASIEKSFSAVPKLQKCSRQMVITFKPNGEGLGSDYRQIDVKKLADERTLYTYLDTGCEEYSEPLIAYLKQVQSY